MASAAKTEVLVIGLGAVGALYTYVLQQSGQCTVTAVARSNCKAVTEHGITLTSPKFGNHKFRPDRTFGSLEQALDRRYRFVLVTTKCLPDVSPTADLIKPLFDGNGEGPTIVLLQNGIGIEAPVQAAFSRAEIISTCIWIGANMRNGIELEHGSIERLVIGLYTGEEPVREKFKPLGGDLTPSVVPTQLAPSQRAGTASVELFSELLRSGGSEVEVCEPHDLQARRWAKLLWNSSLSSFSALTRSPTTALLTNKVIDHTLPIVRRIMLELIYVARAVGITEQQLPLSLVDSTLQMTVAAYSPDRTTTPDFKPSLLLDMEANRPIELEPIIGNVIDRARYWAIETPRLDMLYALLIVYQAPFRPEVESDDEADLVDPRVHKTDTPQRRRSVAGPGKANGVSRMSDLPTPVKEMLSSPSPILDAVSPRRKAKDKVLGRPVGIDDRAP